MNSRENNGDRFITVEHRWDFDNDRWIYVEYYESGYLGLNFMQGNEYELFKKSYCVMDRGLSEFYNENKETIKKYPGASELETINTAMWLFHSAVSSNDWFNKDKQTEIN